MNKLKNSKYLFPAIVLLVFIMNVIQGSFSELLPDEAYYWVYSQHIDWGFFDHPPLVAVWISISDFLFQDEIGVRFFSAISFSLLTYIVWLTIDHPRKKEFTWLFLIVFFSTALLNVYGFITTPDTPLMLFCGLFLYAYQQYLSMKSTLSYFLLSISMAGMMYSKYQGILIIFFLLLSNWKLIKDYKVWLACLGSFILYLPHLDWQLTNDFVSFNYHLKGRVSNRQYKFEHTLMHFVNMIAIVGLTFPIIYKAFFKNIRTKNLFSKGLNFIIIGFLIFFFFSSFRGRVQAQWIVPISIPLILITFNYLIEKEKSRKWFIRLAFINIAIILVARTLIIYEDLSPKKLNFHGNKAWALNLQSKTKDQDKVFVNSYQNTAAYWYYTKEESYYMKNFTGRDNHFLMLQKKKDLSTDKVAIVSRNRLVNTDYATQIRGKDSSYVTNLKDYKDVSKLEMNIISDSIVFKKDTITILNIEISNNSSRSVCLSDLKTFITFLRNKKMELVKIESELITNSTNILASEVLAGSIRFNTIHLPEKDLFPTFGIGITNSEKIEIIRVSKLLKYSVED